MPTNQTTLLKEVVSAPIGELIASVGRGVAEAQRAMDAQTIEALRVLATENGALFTALREIGYRPNWYHIPEVTAELAIAVKLSGEEATSTSGLALYGAPVDAAYTGRYNYDVQAASVIKFKVVPVPPSPAAEALRVVPKLVGLTVEKAKDLLRSLSIPLSLPNPPPDDNATIKTQSLEAGAVLVSGAVSVTT